MRTRRTMLSTPQGPPLRRTEAICSQEGTAMTSARTCIAGMCCLLTVLMCSAQVELALHYDFSERARDVLRDRGGRDNDTT